ncbi:MAG TPA: hypothetical protein VNZ45_08450, partial [Bacteroidia bacterium]|nr:hypothetical protein [Bacteroidia bacterium]
MEFYSAAANDDWQFIANANNESFLDISAKSNAIIIAHGAGPDASASTPLVNSAIVELEVNFTVHKALRVIQP